MSVRRIKESIRLMTFGFGATIIFAIAFVEESPGFSVCGNETVPVDNKVMLIGCAVFLLLLVSNLALIGYLKSATQYAYWLISFAIATNLFVLISGLDEVLGMIQVEKLILWFLAASRGDISLSLNNWYSENTLAKMNGMVAAIALLIGWVIVIRRTLNDTFPSRHRSQIFGRDA